MTPQERLESIENIVKYHMPNWEINNPHPLKTDAMYWLINRVKTLEKALEFYGSGICARVIGYTNLGIEIDRGETARKALNGGEE